jgi:hypothetical protein
MFLLLSVTDAVFVFRTPTPPPTPRPTPATTLQPTPQPTPRPTPVGSVCNRNNRLEPGEVCDGGPCCDASCHFKAAGTTCIDETVCKFAAVCDGGSATCGVQLNKGMSTVCRAASGVCDAPEYCNNGACPADVKLGLTSVCRASRGDCDVAEFCNGADNDCSPDVKKVRGAQCRAATEPCDLPEECDGNSPMCPGDAVRPSSFNCAGTSVPNGCADSPKCDGVTKQCPAVGRALPSGSVCRSAAGTCDVVERCDGRSLTCPADAKLPSSTLCRDANGACDSAEFCNGNDATCPADRFKLSGSICRSTAQNSNCDIAETCTGSSPQCPTDVFQPTSVACRFAYGPLRRRGAVRRSLAVLPSQRLPASGFELLGERQRCGCVRRRRHVQDDSGRVHDGRGLPRRHAVRAAALQCEQVRVHNCAAEWVRVPRCSERVRRARDVQRTVALVPG